VSSPPGAVSVTSDVGELWLPSHCRIVTPALQQAGTWEPDDGAALAAALKPGMTVVDVGAHVGYFALLAARLVGPDGRVVAIEPDPANFQLLEANVARAGVGNVETVNAAAWHSSGEVELALSETNSGDHRVGLGGDRRKLRVPAVAVDDVLGPDAPVDFVLLDTQGAEAAVVAGMRRSLERWRPRLQVEFWPAGIHELGGDPRAVLGAYEELGYEIAVLGGAPEGVLAAAEASAGGFVTLLLTPRPVTLSVCIPTHGGRRRVLGETIDSVVSQIEGELAGRVRIHVSDNASDDGTAELMRRLPWRDVEYRRNGADIGAGANLLRAVEMADGDYVWLLGSDDRLEPGAVARALELLDTHPGAAGMTANKVSSDASMTVELAPDAPPMVPPQPHRLRVYRDAETALDECGLAHGLMSTQICRRSEWLAAAADDPLEHTRLAPHVLVIERMLLRNPRWIWCPEPLVRQRCDPATVRAGGHTDCSYRAAILADVEPMWAELFGRRSRVYRSLVDRWCQAMLPPHAILAWKRADDLRRHIPTLTHHAWRSRYFRRRSLPALLLPRRIARRLR
jgi:FkbM family methyltransferase